MYYPAGLISLILLPILCIWYLEKNRAFHKLVCLEVVYWGENHPSYYKQEFVIHPEREFVNLKLTGNERENKIKLDFAQLTIRELVATKDTVTGIHFILDDGLKYKTLIYVLDILEVENARQFVAREDDIWVFNYIPKLKPKEQELKPGFICGTPYVLLNQKNTKSDKQIEEENKAETNYIIQTAETFSVSVVLFIIMIVLTFKRNYYNKS